MEKKPVIAKKEFIWGCIIAGIISIPIYILGIFYDRKVDFFKELATIIFLGIFILTTLFANEYLYVQSKNHISFTHFQKSMFKKEVDNIDENWNNILPLKEVKDVEIVFLKKKEREGKVYYKHFGKKYLKVTLLDEKEKYIYISGFTKKQIHNLIALIESEKKPTGYPY